VTDAFANRPATLRDYLAIVRRRKWIIVTLPIVAAAAAFFLSNAQARVYRAQASVLVNRSVGVSTNITGVDPSTADPFRYLSTQADIARSPALATRVVATSGVPGLTPGAMLGMSSVTPRGDADVLDFAVTGGDAAQAAAVANAYAREFTHYKSQLDTARIQDALRALRTRLANLRRNGQGDSGTAQTLGQYESQLLTALKLVSNSTTVLQPAEGAAQISPHPKRNLVAAALLGLVIALGLAFLAESLDRRIRTEDEIRSILGLPLLGRIQAPSRKLQNGKGLVMLAEPMTVQAESFRKLRTSIEFVNRDLGARTLMFSSSVQGEGKSTTVANVAVAFARAGRRVALVDFDIRQPTLHSFFGVRGDRGIADVLVDRHELNDVIQRIALPAASSLSRDGRAEESNARWAPADVPARGRGSSARSSNQHVLHFIACGTIPTVDDEFLVRERISAALATLAESFDLVLLDAPPFLAVGEAMALGTIADGIVVVTRLGTQRPILRELARELHQSQAHALGFVLTGVPRREGHAYGYGYGYGYEYEPHPEERGAATTQRA
jgi:polysaccharide biosynthesis transport protein